MLSEDDTRPYVVNDAFPFREPKKSASSTGLDAAADRQAYLGSVSAGTGGRMVEAGVAIVTGQLEKVRSDVTLQASRSPHRSRSPNLGSSSLTVAEAIASGRSVASKDSKPCKEAQQIAPGEDSCVAHPLQF